MIVIVFCECELWLWLCFVIVSYDCDCVLWLWVMIVSYDCDCDCACAISSIRVSILVRSVGCAQSSAVSPVWFTTSATAPNSNKIIAISVWLNIAAKCNIISNCRSWYTANDESYSQSPLTITFTITIIFTQSLSQSQQQQQQQQQPKSVESICDFQQNKTILWNCFMCVRAVLSVSFHFFCFPDQHSYCQMGVGTYQERFCFCYW